jgi:hypothetical protein
MDVLRRFVASTIPLAMVNVDEGGPYGLHDSLAQSGTTRQRPVDTTMIG